VHVTTTHRNNQDKHHQEIVAHKEIEAMHNEMKAQNEIDVIVHKELINVVDEAYV
jgi:hypothetical protein